MSVLHLLMQKKRKYVFWYPSPLHPIRTENSVERRSCLLPDVQRAESSSSLLCLEITALHLCSNVERREEISNCKTDRKLAKMTATL